MNKQWNRLGILSQLMTLPFIAIAFLLLLQSVSGYSDKNDTISRSHVQEIVEKYALQCYASEGSYPPNLEYLVDHYGLILDEKRYIYEYSIFASNIMPEILVSDNVHHITEP